MKCGYIMELVKNRILIGWNFPKFKINPKYYNNSKNLSKNTYIPLYLKN